MKNTVKIDQRQYEDLLSELEDNPYTLEQIYKYYSITSLKDLPLDQFHTLQKEIRRINKILNK